MKRIFFILLSFLILQQAFATSIYEIKYKFSGAEYTAFFIRYDNKTGFMRVLYYPASGKVQVVHMDFDETEGTDNGDKTLKFKGKNPRYVIGKIGADYYPDIIWFKKKPGATDFSPWGVTSPHPDGTHSQGTIVNVRLLDKNEISTTYLKSFFNEDEPFFVNLLYKGKLD